MLFPRAVNNFDAMFYKVNANKIFKLCSTGACFIVRTNDNNNGATKQIIVNIFYDVNL